MPYFCATATTLSKSGSIGGGGFEGSSSLDTSRVWPSPSRTARVAARFLPVGLSRRRGHQQRLAVPVEGQRHQVRRTVRRGTGHPDVFVVGEPMLGVATTLSAGAGVGTHRS
jgi:hypothetical protein